MTLSVDPPLTVTAVEAIPETDLTRAAGYYAADLLSHHSHNMSVAARLPILHDRLMALRADARVAPGVLVERVLRPLVGDQEWIIRVHGEVLRTADEQVCRFLARDDARLVGIRAAAAFTADDVPRYCPDCHTLFTGDDHLCTPEDAR